MAAYVSVIPLVATRELDREFTYELPAASGHVGRGAVVEVPFGRTSRRAVVTVAGVDAPDGVQTRAIGRVLGRVPEPLLELALWLAGYYGTPPARALALVAPVERSRRGARREPAAADLPAEPRPPQLTAAQRRTLARLEAARGSGGSFLLYGATGSGKTEVYLEACASALARGEGAIVLVPEIALTPQALARFRARFGTLVAVLHSGLSDAERRDERERIALGEARVVVGARSAVFAPVARLGLICVDEEHDASYKQDSDPRYDARTVAAKRAILEGAVAVFGSATPRPETWLRLERLELGGRIGAPAPRIRVVDLRREQGYPLSAPLLAELGRIADGGGRAIVLLNRRGLAPALHCRACGTTPRCAGCDVSLVLHDDGRLHCHHCGHREPAGSVCRRCGASDVARIGAGTQQLERELVRRLPELTVMRLDAETAALAGRHAAVLERFAASDRAVLVGTQMVAKGHHFSGVELAAVVDAGSELAVPDFRSDERTFQLLVQLAGRSGRDRPGRVIVQAWDPEARPVALAAHGAVEEFLAGELARREALRYPPFGHLVRVLVSGPDPDRPLVALREVGRELEAAGGDAQVLGPAPLLRLRGRHRAQLVVKTAEPRRVAGRAARILAAAAAPMRRDGLTTSVDVDPV